MLVGVLRDDYEILLQVLTNLFSVHFGSSRNTEISKDYVVKAGSVSNLSFERPEW